MEYFRASKSTKIKIRCQVIVYLKLNKWRAKILKKTLTWFVILRRNKKLSCVFTTDKMSHGSQKEIEIWKSVNYWQNFYSCTITAIIWENNGNGIFPFMQYQHFVIFFILSKTHLHRWICCVKFFAKSSPKPGQWTSIVFLCIVAILWFPPAKNINWTSV